MVTSECSPSSTYLLKSGSCCFDLRAGAGGHLLPIASRGQQLKLGLRHTRLLPARSESLGAAPAGDPLQPSSFCPSPKLLRLRSWFVAAPNPTGARRRASSAGQDWVSLAVERLRYPGCLDSRPPRGKRARPGKYGMAVCLAFIHPAGAVREPQGLGALWSWCGGAQQAFVMRTWLPNRLKITLLLHSTMVGTLHEGRSSQVLRKLSQRQDSTSDCPKAINPRRSSPDDHQPILPRDISTSGV